MPMNKLAEQIIRTKDMTKIEYVSMLLDVGRNDKDLEVVKRVIALCRKNIKKQSIGDTKAALEFHKLYKAALLCAAPYDFDSYLLYVELNRPPHERFYLPRRKVMLPVVIAMQELADYKLDELFLSMPPRVGKTTLLLFLQLG